ncbi:hypothetical protein AB0945_36630 [Streptomyces sp. NPDC005474]|uniref:hypothetical protein n=1 Tax=Streptomyces sp. NPDC005474 TaxID=3154878 RepID=UPI0034537B49
MRAFATKASRTPPATPAAPVNGATTDLTRFARALVSRRQVPATNYLTGVEAGPEVFRGAGQLDNSTYSAVTR